MGEGERRPRRQSTGRTHFPLTQTLSLVGEGCFKGED